MEWNDQDRYMREGDFFWGMEGGVWMEEGREGGREGVVVSWNRTWDIAWNLGWRLYVRLFYFLRRGK